MNIDLNDLLKKNIISETSELELKESLETSKPKSWLKTVSAFANSSGGSIIWGISDSHNVVGVTDVHKTIEKITELIKAKIEPMISFRINTVETDSKILIQLDIKPGTSIPYFYVSDGNKIAYVRIGNESVVAQSHILTELIMKGNRLSFDSMESKFKKDDLSFTLFEATYKQRTGIYVDKTIDYVSFGLVNESGILTNAGVLISDQCPILHSRIFCTRWNGLDKGSIFEDAIDDKEYSGSLISLLENGVAFVKNNSKFKWKKTPSGRDNMPDFPERAVFEVLVNSLIHRDYMNICSEVHIDMYDDRLEITSPGGMFDGKRIQDLDLRHVPSARRNPVLSDLFHRLNYMERRGSGIKKILREYENTDIPKFFSDQSFFIVTLNNKNYVNSNKSGSVKGSVKSSVKSSVKDISDSKSQIMMLISNNPKITMPAIADSIGISKRAVEKHISNLKSDGFLDRVGGRKEGKWQINIEKYDKRNID